MDERAQHHQGRLSQHVLGWDEHREEIFRRNLPTDGRFAKTIPGVLAQGCLLTWSITFFNSDQLIQRHSMVELERVISL